MKKRKYKLAILFISCLSIFLIVISLLYTYSSRKAIDKIGKLAIRIDQKNNQTLSTELFYDITVNTANLWSERFNVANNAVEMLGKIVHKQLTSNYRYKDKAKLTKYKGRDFFVGTSQNILLMFYWGNEDHVPQNIVNKITSLRNRIDVFAGIYNLYPKIYLAVYFVSTESFAFGYPQLKIYYENIKNREYYKNYYNFSNYPSRIIGKSETVLEPCLFIKPYRDLSGIITMTAKTRIYDKGKFLGYVAIDFDFNKLKDAMLISKLSKGITDKRILLKSFFFLLDENDYIITFPKEYADLFSIPKDYQDMGNQFKTNSIKLSSSTDPEIKTLGKKIKNHNSGLENVIINNQDYMIAFSTIKETDWKLAYVIKNKTLLTSTVATKELINFYIKKIFKNYLWSIILFLIISFYILYLLFKRYVLWPINRIKKGINKMKHGNFNVNLKEEGASEIVELSSAFNYLGKELDDYMKNLKVEITARQAIETEINIAERIQRSILPDAASFPTNGNFQIVSKLNAAKHVSGDFYDFFYINEKKIAFLIADVSGKGLQAAFFMATSKALIKNLCLWKSDEGPGNVLKEVNKSLCMDNKAQMFVTVSLTFYNIEDGTVSYANAGHHAAILIRDNSIIRPKKLNNIALGIFEDAEYETCLNKTNINDIIILYTDGVPEAVSLEEEEYGEERLEKLVLKNKELSLDELCDTIVNDVVCFEAENRFDDMTLLAFKRHK